MGKALGWIPANSRDLTSERGVNKILRQLRVGVFTCTDCCQKRGGSWVALDKVGEGKAGADIYCLLLSACGTGNGESCYVPFSESTQSHPQ